MALNTIALELVPPNVERGADYAVEEARKVLALSADAGIEGRIRHVMIPGMIEEDDDRPIEMKPKLDVLDYWSIIKPELPGMNGLCTQVTSFLDQPTLGRRLADLRDAGFDGIAFVGVPRTMADGEGAGVAPTDALSIYDERRPQSRRHPDPHARRRTGPVQLQVRAGRDLRHDAAAVLGRDRGLPHRVRQDDRASARDPAVLRIRPEDRDRGGSDQLADPGSRQRRRRRRAGVRRRTWPVPTPTTSASSWSTSTSG